MPYTEEHYENAILDIFENHLGYNHLYGPDIVREYTIPWHVEILRDSLKRINPALPGIAIEEAVRKLTHSDFVDLVKINEQFMDRLQNGVEVSYLQNGTIRNGLVSLVDFDNVDKNDFTVINQWTIIERETKRPDIVVFVNGLPLVVIELKSCSREATGVSSAYRQLRNYMQDIPTLFHYNAFCVISDLVTSRAGTITAGEDRYMEWKTTTGDYEETKFASFETLFIGMFEKQRLLDIIRSFTLFSHDEGKIFKILAGYHQYYAVNKAVGSTRNAVHGDGKAGIFWHTQGSGKSLSMVFYAKLLQKALENPTLVVLTDRNDLDDQLYSTFSACMDFLRQTPEQAESRADLRALLAGRQANGIIFTTMQKFEESDEPLSDRRNIVLIADEAHRSQYGLDEKVDGKTGRLTAGYARLVRNSLPNGAFIGFTGTPVSEKDHNSIEVFGNYIDVYDMTQSVADGATRPIFYENRVIRLGLQQEVLDRIDKEYVTLARNAEPWHIEKSKRQLGQMESILSANETIEALCRDVVAHYEDRADLLTGKAMIVAYSRAVAMKIYREILRLRPNWDEKIKLVMTSSNDDPEDWKQAIGTKQHRKELETQYKNNDSKMKIAIVVDMWLTGFDIPSLATMYIFKPMVGHTLMQAIARVNRVFGEKEGGLVVDYVGIAKALKQAMNDYTRRDQEKYGEPDIGKTALPKFFEKLSICRDLFHGFDYSKFITGSDLDRANLIRDGINFILSSDQKKDDFVRQALMLSQAQTLCRSLLEREVRFEFAFFEAVRVAITRITLGEKFTPREINERINALLKQMVKSEGVINVFKDAHAEFSLFDPDFLKEIAGMKQRNLALELLKKLLAEQIAVYMRSNVVKSELFSEKMKRLMNAYLNAQITNAEVIAELLKLAEEIQRDRKEGEAMGLTEEEKAFYDALTKPQAVRDFYENDVLIAMAKKLTETLRNSRTIDWQKKLTARAEMRSQVKKLLKKYKYPPDEEPNALEAVIQQCEQWG